MGGKAGGTPKINYEEEMQRQQKLMERQMALQQQYQREAEDRMQRQRERERELELARRREAAQEKEQQLVKEEQQEAAVLQEMQGQTSKESSEFGGGFNLAMPTIERPGYERLERPE